MKRAISKCSTVVAAKDQVFSDLGEEVAILDLKAGVYYGLDAVGTRVWKLVQEPRAVVEIQDILLLDYDVEPERCERDLLALLRQLADAGLLEVSDGTPA